MAATGITLPDDVKIIHCASPSDTKYRAGTGMSELVREISDRISEELVREYGKPPKKIIPFGGFDVRPTHDMLNVMFVPKGPGQHVQRTRYGAPMK